MPDSTEIATSCGHSTPGRPSWNQEDVPPTAHVKLFVGPERRLFEIREDLICSRCPYFNNAFRGDFLEAKTKTLELIDDDPARFQELQAWLDEDGSIPNLGQSWLALSRMWLFAEKYHIDEFQNAIVDELYKKYASHETGVNIAFETLDYVAEHTSARSPLRLLFADMLVNGTSLLQIPSRADSIPHEFLQEIWLALKTHIDANQPTNISLLTKPIRSYYVSSAACKATAMPKPVNEAGITIELYCQGDGCAGNDPPTLIRDIMYICTSHNVTLCEDCSHSHYGHRKRMMTLVNEPYRDSTTGAMAIIDSHVTDSGFWCDGPKCDTRLKGLDLPDWALIGGERYHCLECDNIDYCTVCVRGELDCKTQGHRMLRIRSDRSRKTRGRIEAIPIPEKQRRLAGDLCVRCASGEHTAESCDAKEAVLTADVPAEE